MLLFCTQEGLLLTKYEMLLDVAEKEDVIVEETSHFSGTRIKGLYEAAEYLGVTEEF